MAKIKSFVFNLSIFEWVCGFAGAFILAIYTQYFIVAVITNSAVKVAFFFTAAVYIAVLLPFLLRNFFKKFFGRAYGFIKWIWCACMWLYILFFSIFAISIITYDSSAAGVYESIPQGEPVVVVTFGCKTQGMTPGLALRRRLNVTYDILEHYPDSVVVVSGGQGADESAAEAVAMKSWLVNKGIDVGRIYLEDQATDTIENLRYSFKIINDQKLEGKLIGVSAFYHAPRIKLLSERFGVQMHVVGNQKFDLAGITREFMAYVKLFIFNRNVSE